MRLDAEMIKGYVENKNIQLILICLLLLLLNIFDISNGELFYNNDEPRHALNGVFIYDLIRDLPLNPIQYAYEYYVQYPALGIIHWPPFFYLVEALFYSIFGVTAESGRIAIIFFSLIGIIYWYKLVYRMYNKNIAFFSSILLITAQPIVLYSKVVMLEIPFLALSIITIYYFYSSTVEGNKRDIYLCSLFLALAILTKQNAIFLPVLFIVYILSNKKYDILKNRNFLIAIFILAVLVVPYNLFVLSNTFSSVSKDLLQGTTNNAGSISSLDTYLYYLKVLPGQVGWIVLTVFVVSVFHLILKRKVKENSLLFLWIIVCYLVFTLISQKSPRYIICWIPPMFLFVVLFLDSISIKIKKVSISFVFLIVLSASQIVHAVYFEKPYISGYERAAEIALEKEHNGILFFDGYFDANFIFYVRKNDKERKVIVFRGSKVLYTTNIFSEYEMLPLLNNKQEIDDFFEDYGVKYIVVEEKRSYEHRINKILRELLQDTNKFALIERINLDTNLKEYKNIDILVYENKRDVKRSKKNIELKMLTLGGKNIDLDLEKKQQ